MIYLFFMGPSAWSSLHLPSSPSLPGEFLLLLLLGSSVTYLLGQGPAPDPPSPCGTSIIALFTLLHYQFTFPTNLWAP